MGPLGCLGGPTLRGSSARGALSGFCLRDDESAEAALVDLEQRIDQNAGRQCNGGGVVWKSPYTEPLTHLAVSFETISLLRVDTSCSRLVNTLKQREEDENIQLKQREEDENTELKIAAGHWLFSCIFLQ